MNPGLAVKLKSIYSQNQEDFRKIFFVLGCSTSLQSILDDEINSYEGPWGVKKIDRGKDDHLIFVVAERVWEEKLPSFPLVAEWLGRRT